MLQRHSRLVAASAALLLCFAAPAGAQVVLWDQSNWNTNTEGSLNLSSTSCSQISGNTKLHTASDVHFASPVHITSISIYETAGNVDAATQAYLWIAPKTGPIPTAISTDVNNAANIKPITISTVTNGAAVARMVTAAGLNIDLPAGDYWVSLTPRHSRGVFPYTVHLITSSAPVGDPTAMIEACVANSNWLYALPGNPDYSLKIMGDFPVPTASSSWGRVKAFYR